MRLKIVTKLWEIYYFIFSVIDDHLLCWNCFDNSLWVFFLSFHLKRTAFIFTSVKFNEFSSSKWLCIFIQLMTYCLLTMKSLTRSHQLQICLTVVISLMKEAENCFCCTDICVQILYFIPWLVMCCSLVGLSPLGYFTTILFTERRYGHCLWKIYH